MNREISKNTKTAELAEKKKSKIVVIALTAAVILITAVVCVVINADNYTPINYNVYGFANMCGDGGKVYRGIGGAYGEDVAVEASTIAVRGDKIYYAGQIKEDYVVNEERFGTICEADLDGTNERVLVEDAYNLGYGLEKLIGDKTFYPNGFDEDYNTTFAWYDITNGEKGVIESSRIGNIFGYDGTCIIYSGYDVKKECNIIGKYYLDKGKDKTLIYLNQTGELGDVISIYYYDGIVYTVELMQEMQDYDARTAVYKMFAHSADNGKVIKELPLEFTGSANYGFLYWENDVYFSAGEWICHVSLAEEDNFDITKLSQLSEREYWGIPHFAPGDGFLYYEAIADIDEDTGMNDYFYRVPLEGGEAELLAAWFVS